MYISDKQWYMQRFSKPYIVDLQTVYGLVENNI